LPKNRKRKRKKKEIYASFYAAYSQKPKSDIELNCKHLKARMINIC
jgi:hypothetical protein